MTNETTPKWEPQLVRLYSPSGTLIYERIKYTLHGEWQEPTEQAVKSLWRKRQPGAGEGT